MSKKNNSNSSKSSSNKEFITLGHTPGQKGYTPTQASTTSKPPKGGSGVPPKKK